MAHGTALKSVAGLAKIDVIGSTAENTSIIREKEGCKKSLNAK